MDKTNGCSGKRIAVSVIVGVVVMATVTADHHLVVRQMYKTDDGIVVEEETNVTETEVDIRVPNMAEFIYDYKTGLAVQRFVGREDKAQTACYAQYMNETYAPNRDANRYTDGEMDLYKRNSTEEAETEKWRVTNREVPGNMISENVARICEGTKIYWIEKVQGEEINKRQTCDFYQSYLLYFSLNYACQYICRVYYVCVIGNVGIYWYTSNEYYCLYNCDPGANNPVCPP